MATHNIKVFNESKMIIIFFVIVAIMVGVNSSYTFFPDKYKTGILAPDYFDLLIFIVIFLFFVIFGFGRIFFKGKSTNTQVVVNPGEIVVYKNEQQINIKKEDINFVSFPLHPGKTVRKIPLSGVNLIIGTNKKNYSFGGTQKQLSDLYNDLQEQQLISEKNIFHRNMDVANLQKQSQEMNKYIAKFTPLALLIVGIIVALAIFIASLTL